MSEFDARARNWDNEKVHVERSTAIASFLEKMIPLKPEMQALEYGAGTGILSFLMKDRFASITLMDSSREMIRVCEEKKDYYQTAHIHPLYYDLEHTDFDTKFDIIYNQMVLHHVVNVEAILRKFGNLLNPGGFLAIADLYPEDGSFHGMEVTNVHKGFDPEKLAHTLKNEGFLHTEIQPCFEVKRDTGKTFPIFLLVAQK